MSQKSPETEKLRIEPTTARRIRQILIQWGRKNYQNFPWRHSEQPWHALIAEILLQRTRAQNVVPVYLRFVDLFPTPEDLCNASISDIEELIYPLGLKWRALWLQRLGQELAKSKGVVPDTLENLLILPGVGSYAASAWLSFHGNKRGVIIDANVVRLLCRLVGEKMDGETRRKKWLINLAEILTPKTKWKEYNYSILDFTMQVCIKKPRCTQCPIKAQCHYPAEK